jgi:uncharacterized protein YkwD
VTLDVAVPDPREASWRVEAAVNAHRRRLALPALEPHPVLAAAARQHAQRMRNLGFFAHVDPFDDTSPLQRVRAIDPRPWALLAENLSAGACAAEAIVQGWIDSPAHRANLEHPQLTHVGTELTVGGAFGAYAAQVYGRAVPRFALGLRTWRRAGGAR